MSLKRIFTTGEKAVYRIAQEVAADHGVEALAKVRIADAIEIRNSGITDREYSFALKAHFDVLIVKNNLPLIAIEFDGSGHDPTNDHLKNGLCDRFQLPLVRVNMSHVNAKNFEDSAVHFFLFQLFGVDEFLEDYANDPYEIYDPAFYVSAPGKDKSWPFAYANKWRGRLTRHFRENLDLLDGSWRDIYKLGLLGMAASEGVWKRNDHFRAMCAQKIGDNAYIVGTENLAVQVFGMSELRRENYLHVWPFVNGLAAGNMYENAVAFRDGDKSGLMTTDQLRRLLVGWSEEGFELQVGQNLPAH